MAGWYAVRTKAHCERFAITHIARAGVVHFLPLLRDSRERVVPLFPRYLFVFADLVGLGPVMRARGVEYVLGPRRGQTPVRPQLIEALIGRQDAMGGVVIDERPAEAVWAPGDGARVMSGPFEGFLGTVLEARRDQVKLHLLLFGRPTETTVPARALEAA